MTTCNSSHTLSFPKPIKTPIESQQTCPSYASLNIAQSELNRNAASIHSNLGGGQHVHIALIIKEALLLTKSPPLV
jgi:hypothetical protein